MHKRIAVIGRSRTGKSRIISRFSTQEDLLRKLFSGGGKDMTDIPFEYSFSLPREENKSQPYIRYFSPESALNGQYVALSDEEEVKEFLDKIKNQNTYSSNVSDKAGEKKLLDMENDIIRVVTEASEWAQSFFTKDDDYITVVDTPGVSGKYAASKHISNATTFLFVMRNENLDEFEQGVSKLMPVIAGSNVVFVYRTDQYIESEADYLKNCEDAKRGIEDFQGALQTLNKNPNSILNSSLSLLNPSENVVSMAVFQDSRINFGEEKFNADLKEALHYALNEDSYIKEEAQLLEAVKAPDGSSMATAGYLQEIISGFQPTPSTAEESYLPQFLSRKHDRVKTGDRWEVANCVEFGRERILRELREYYDGLRVDESKLHFVSKQTQEAVIRYCYKKLSDSCKNDCGISYSTHAFESDPSITMWAEESLLAEKLLAREGEISEKFYEKVFVENNIKSSSWEYVHISTGKSWWNVKHLDKKLEIIKKCGLNQLPSKNAEELIFNSYLLGLMKLGEYSIYTKVLAALGNDEDAMEWTCKGMNQNK